MSAVLLTESYCYAANIFGFQVNCVIKCLIFFLEALDHVM